MRSFRTRFWLDDSKLFKHEVCKPSNEDERKEYNKDNNPNRCAAVAILDGSGVLLSLIFAVKLKSVKLFLVILFSDGKLLFNEFLVVGKGWARSLEQVFDIVG